MQSSIPKSSYQSHSFYPFQSHCTLSVFMSYVPCSSLTSLSQFIPMPSNSFLNHSINFHRYSSQPYPSHLIFYLISSIPISFYPFYCYFITSYRISYLNLFIIILYNAIQTIPAFRNLVLHSISSHPYCILFCPIQSHPDENWPNFISFVSTLFLSFPSYSFTSYCIINRFCLSRHQGFLSADTPVIATCLTILTYIIYVPS